MKSKTTAGLLAIFLGSFGAHRFYLGNWKLGIVYALFFWTLIPGIVGVFEGIWYLAMSEEKFYRRFQVDAPPDQSTRHREEETPVSEPTQRQRPQDPVAGTVTVEIHGPSSRESYSKEDKLQQSERAWVPPGEATEIQGYDVEGGMLYVGSELASVQGYTDPAGCLVDPTLETDAQNLDPSGRRMSYWPSYSQIDPGCRATYLEWLEEGRRHPRYDIGYVFLFFYGLERRVFFDARHLDLPKDEPQRIIDEVESLLEVYGDNSSFRRYGESFLEAAKALHCPETLQDERISDDAPRWELPLALKVQIAQRMVDGEPIPGNLALEWYRRDPSTSLRTPATRCQEEFENLFLVRYRERFGDGLAREPNKTRLKVSYNPASQSIPRVHNLEVGDLPDISRLSAPVRRIDDVVEQCCDELDSYSRHVGKTGDRTSLKALALLPSELVERRQSEQVQKVVDVVEDVLDDSRFAKIPLGRLVNLWPIEPDQTAKKKHLRNIAELLESLGFGIEPDVRFGAPTRGREDPAVVFRLDGQEAEIEPEISDSVRLVQKLAIAVAAADGQISREEIDRLSEFLESSKSIEGIAQRRLKAHRRWLALDSPTLHGVRQRAEDLEEGERQKLAGFLVALAGADGEIDPGEVSRLSKIYPMLGLEERDVHRTIHRLQMTGSGDMDDPVTIRPGSSDSPGYRIPEPPANGDADQLPEHPVKLDMEKVEETLDETEEVGEFLGEIFSDDEGSPRADSLPPRSSPVDPEDDVQSLTEPQAELLRKLSGKEAWNRGELESLASALDLFPDLAIEAINDAAFEETGVNAIEDGSTVHINQDVCEEVLS